MNNIEGKYKNYILVAFVICLMSISLLIRLFQEGMFFDGITYASISRNMAIGVGTFWKPFYISNFYEHPPLMFGIQSYFFKIFGDHYLIEKFYCLIIFVITVYIIIAIWNLIFKDESDTKRYFWIPLLLWFLMPTVYWASVVNLLDNTLAVFTLAATYLKLRSLIYKKNIFFYGFLSALLVFLAFLVKGPTALFPLSITVIYFISDRSISLVKAIGLSLFEGTIFLLLFGLLLLYQPAREFLVVYFNQQIVQSLTGKREVVVTPIKHFQVIVEVCFQLIPAILLTLFVSLYKKQLLLKNYRKQFIFFLLLGLVSSIPIIVSIKQRSFYIIPSLPYYTLSFSILLLPFLMYKIQNISIKLRNLKIILLIISIITITGVVFSTNRINSIGRDKNVLEDLKIFDKYLRTTKQIFAGPEISTDWTLVAYLQRNYKIVLINQFSDSIPIMRLKNNANKMVVPSGYVEIDGHNYVLFINH